MKQPMNICFATIAFVIIVRSSASRSDNDLGVDDFSVENVLNGISEYGFQNEVATNGIINEDGDNNFIDEDKKDQNDILDEEIYEKYLQNANEVEGRRTLSEEEIRDISVKVKHSGEEKEVVPLYDCSKPDDLFNTYMKWQLDDLFGNEKQVQYECEYTNKALRFLDLPKAFNYLDEQKLTVMIHKKLKGKKTKRGLNTYDLSTKVSWKFLCNLHQVKIPHNEDAVMFGCSQDATYVVCLFGGKGGKPLYFYEKYLKPVVLCDNLETFELCKERALSVIDNNLPQERHTPGFHNNAKLDFEAQNYKTMVYQIFNKSDSSTSNRIVGTRLSHKIVSEEKENF